MRSTREDVGWFQVVVLTWTILWVLAAPLIHIHPDADHRHGAVDHWHGGTVHTVFSPDLNCEFSRYDHAVAAAHESRCPLHLIAQPLHGAEHLEIDFILASSAEPQVGKGTGLDVAAHSVYVNQPLRLLVTRQPCPGPSSTNLFLATGLTSRAPSFA
jgi:hypothetical protein